MTEQAAGSGGRGWFWPGLVVGLLALQIALCAWAVVKAVGAPGGEVVPDYYRRGLKWDERATEKPTTLEVERR
jgi:hypothetical protein